MYTLIYTDLDGKEVVCLTKFMSRLLATKFATGPLCKCTAFRIYQVYYEVN